MEFCELPESRSEARDYKGHTIWVRAQRSNPTAPWIIFVDLQSLTTGAWLPSICDDTLAFADLGEAFDEGASLGRQSIDMNMHRVAG